MESWLEDLSSSPCHHIGCIVPDSLALYKCASIFWNCENDSGDNLIITYPALLLPGHDEKSHYQIIAVPFHYAFLEENVVTGWGGMVLN